MKRILVTGGAGFIGSHLVDLLVKNGHKVTVFDDYSGGSATNTNEHADYYYVDLRDADIVDGLMEKVQPEIVYHLAANAAENKAQFSPIDITSRNYDAFIKVLTPFIRYGGKRFVFTSSIAVYGALQTPFKETDKPEPEDLYGISKLAIEQTLKVMSSVHNFEYVIVRPHNVYGPRQNARDPYRNVVTLWMNAILKGEPYYIYGDGKQKRCFSYIDGVVDALYKVGFYEVSGKTFNIGSDQQYSLNDLSSYMELATKTKKNVKHLPARPQEVKEAIADHTLAKKYLKYQDKTALVDGLIKTFHWLKDLGPQTPMFDQLELVNDKVPKNWL